MKLVMYYTDREHRDLLAGLPDAGFSVRLMEGGVYNLRNITETRHNIVNNQHFVFLRKVFGDSGDDEFLDDLRHFRRHYPEKEITVILRGVAEKGIMPGLAAAGIHNVAAADDIPGLVAEARECLTVGKQKPGPAGAKPNPDADQPSGAAQLAELLGLAKEIHAMAADARAAVQKNAPGAGDGRDAMDAARAELDRLGRENGDVTQKYLEIKRELEDLGKVHGETMDRIASGDAELENLANAIEALEAENRELRDGMAKAVGAAAGAGMRPGPAVQEKMPFPETGVHIAFFGSAGRCGVTNLALGFAKWINDAGGRAAYLDETASSIFGGDSPPQDNMAETKFGHVWHGIDIHRRGVKDKVPNMGPPGDYNYVLHDIGRPDPAVIDGNEFACIVLVGGVKAHELPNMVGKIQLMTQRKPPKNIIIAANHTHAKDRAAIGQYFDKKFKKNESRSTVGTMFVEHMPEPFEPLCNQPLFKEIIFSAAQSQKQPKK